MSNVATLYQLRVRRSYERDGVNDFLNLLPQMARQEVFSDGLTYQVTALQAKTTILTNVGCNVYGIVAAPPSTATTSSWVRLYNTTSASVTSGTTLPDLCFMVSSGVTSTLVMPKGINHSAITAVCIEAVTTVSGGTAANTTNMPTVTILYK